jgi:uncharacterized membrane protein YbhN (UPF0104 family)
MMNYKELILKLFLKIVIGLFFFNYLIVNLNLTFSANNYFSKNNSSLLALAVFLFLFSFVLKFQRLSLLVSLTNPKLKIGNYRKLLNLHSISTIFSIILPFKLGDVVRFLLLRKVTGNYSDAFGIVVLERILDLSVIIILIIITGSIYGYLYFLDGIDTTARLLSLMLAVILAYVLFSSLKFWYDAIASKSFSGLGKVLILVENLIYIIKFINFLFAKRSLDLTLITLVIWLTEAFSFVLVYYYVGENFSLLLFLGFLSFIAFALPAGPVGFGAIQFVFYIASETGMMTSNITDDGIYYSIYMYLPALMFVTVLYLLILLSNKLLK